MHEFVLDFKKNGFYLFKNFFETEEILKIKAILTKSNIAWKKRNNNPDNVNSNYLTSINYLDNSDDREFIFNFIASDKLCNIAKEITLPIFFLNTQIFFNPENNRKLPYWHRDIQYMPISEEEQFQNILSNQVIHFRIPLIDDPGLYFIPGSHLRWDNEIERNTRLELNGYKNHYPLKDEILIPHNKTDLLIFSAHLIHKGNYSKERFSFDIIYTNFKESIEVINKFKHFPSTSEIFNLHVGNETICPWIYLWI